MTALCSLHSSCFVACFLGGDGGPGTVEMQKVNGWTVLWRAVTKSTVQERRMRRTLGFTVQALGDANRQHVGREDLSVWRMGGSPAVSKGLETSGCGNSASLLW